MRMKNMVCQTKICFPIRKELKSLRNEIFDTKTKCVKIKRNNK